MFEMREAGNGSGPASNEQQRYNHLGHHTPMNSHDRGPFRVSGHIAGSMLVIQMLHPRFPLKALICATYKVTLQFISILNVELRLS